MDMYFDPGLDTRDACSTSLSLTGRLDCLYKFQVIVALGLRFTHSIISRFSIGIELYSKIVALTLIVVVNWQPSCYGIKNIFSKSLCKY